MMIQEAPCPSFPLNLVSELIKVCHDAAGDAVSPAVLHKI